MEHVMVRIWNTAGIVIVVVTATLVLGDDAKKADDGITEREQAVIDALNAVRAEEKLPLMKTDAELCRAARLCAPEWARAGKFDWKSLNQIAEKHMANKGRPLRYIFPAGYEADPQTPAKEIVDFWLTKGAKGVLLGQQADLVGVGIVPGKAGEKSRVFLICARMQQK
jgi:uncharacterized protein YkwD